MKNEELLLKKRYVDLNTVYLLMKAKIQSFKNFSISILEKRFQISLKFDLLSIYQ